MSWKFMSRLKIFLTTSTIICKRNFLKIPKFVYINNCNRFLSTTTLINPLQKLMSVKYLKSFKNENAGTKLCSTY